MQGTGAYGAVRRLGLALILFAGLGAGAATAQSTPPAPPAPAPSPMVPAAPPTNAPAASSPAAPAPAPNDTTGASPGDTSISQTIDVQPRPAVILSGSATWDTGFKTLTDVFAQLNDAIGKNGLATAGHPLAVFTSTDDAGFKYSAMIPIAQAPAGKTELTPDIKIGETPGGKAIRFQHRASYDDIDSTYEAITAYLDEKGLEAKNMFAEEYVKMTRTSDDPSLEVDIYVFLK
jgi:effector-binding domain-containing protein